MQVDLPDWLSPGGASELAIYLGGTDCRTLLVEPPDHNDVACWVVTDIVEREGSKYRNSAECDLAPDLVVSFGNLREDREVGGTWERVVGFAVSARPSNLGMLTSATTERVEYGGERVDPVEGCVGVDLLGCREENLPPWQQCRACDKTALFFRPRPVRSPLVAAWPPCLSECPRPPHSAAIAKMGDLGLWRPRADPTSIPVVFKSRAACDAHAVAAAPAASP